MTLVQELIQHEGLRLKPYKCTAGKLTIGVGRNIEDRGISQDEAMYLLDNDIKLSRAELTKNLPWFTKAHVKVKEVLINMHINLGWPRLSGFKNTLSLLGKGKYNEAAAEMLNSQWAKQVGSRAIYLSNKLKSL